ncbi:MAG: FprA family A-type flavoprotein [Clostridia bacterium]|nr:FprA family A-type flavoprotein [Clostridia bacterium]
MGKIVYIGEYDTTLDKFESQFEVPNGVTYNSYIILDDKIAIMDTIDKRKGEEWLANIKEALGGRKPDYLVVSHMEPDHSANIETLVKKYPDIKLVANAKTVPMLKNFTNLDIDSITEIVAEGSTLDLGEHKLTFIMAPLVHWPEVMVEYESTTKTLFSADGFGRFGDFNEDSPWDDEARRYYFNIVGKYGLQTMNLLKKAATLDIQRICPLHGPILTKNLSKYIDLYAKWASYEPEEPEKVLIACASIHGNTYKAAEYLAKKLGDRAVLIDITRTEYSYALSEAFRNGTTVFFCSTYNLDMFSPMADFIERLQNKTWRNRKAAVVDNGSWAPMAGKKIIEKLATFKDITLVNDLITIPSTAKADTLAKLDELTTKL